LEHLAPAIGGLEAGDHDGQSAVRVDAVRKIRSFEAHPAPDKPTNAAEAVVRGVESA
jgi:hypothetical protein